MSKAALWALATACAGILATGTAAAHGIAGKRFFPATLATDDPFVADELSVPTIASRKMSASGEESATRETGFSIDVSKRVTDNLGIGFGATYKVLQPEGGQAQRGFDNLAASVKYKFYQSDERETILSAGVLRPFAVTGLIGLGIPAIIPVNNRSGNRVGWIAQLHFFLDDLFPTSIGRPIFGR